MTESGQPGVAAPASDARRLNLLRQIADSGGSVSPVAEPQAQFGYNYSVVSDDLESDLENLNKRNYLEARFFDRVSLCPKCGTHHVNVREVCPTCRSAHLTSEGLLHHFRCGYVGIPSEFLRIAEGGYRCPKCNGTMRHPGAEFDRLGRAFVCRGCGVISENPPVEAVCLSCGARNPAENLVSTVVHSFALTSRGAAAIRAGSLLDDDEEPFRLDGGAVYRRALILEFLDHELRRLQQLGVKFSVLLVKFASSPAEGSLVDSRQTWLARLRGSLREVDLIGQLADAVYLVILPQMKMRDAEKVRSQIESAFGAPSPLSLTAIEISEKQDLARVVDGLGRRSNS